MARNPILPRSAALQREVLFGLSDVARAVRTRIDQRAREHGMTRAQWAVLSRVERQEGMTQAELAEILEIQPISLVRLVDRLCDQKQLQRRPHPSDRRANLLYLTAKGRSTLARMMPLGREIAGEVFQSFSEAETAALLRALMKIKENIRQVSENTKRFANGARHAG
jgi:DNA-binding MarR family transcriptional regulator